MIGDLFDFRNETAALHRAKLHDRWCTLQMALNWTLQMGGKNVVETGCIRNTDWWDGRSTYVFAEFCARIGGRFWSVDNSPPSVEIALKETAPFKDVTCITLADSVEYLARFEHRIDLLYLDSYDYDVNNPGPAQSHCLRELEAAMPRLHATAFVLIDDNRAEGGGKGELAKGLLARTGFVCLLDHFQSAWVRAR